jgi:hypothetical protein
MNRVFFTILALVIFAVPAVAQNHSWGVREFSDSAFGVYGVASSAISLLPQAQITNDGGIEYDFTAARLAGSLSLAGSSVMGFVLKDPLQRKATQTVVDLVGIGSVVAYSTLTQNGGGEERVSLAISVALPTLLHIFTVWVFE